MIKIKDLIYSVILCALTIQGFAQQNKIATADKLYDSYSFVDAIIIYERIAEKGYKSEEMFQRLGNAYYFNADFSKSAKWYTELFTMNQNQNSEYYYRYSQCLKAIGNYSEADLMLDQFNKKSGNEQRSKLYQSHRNYLEEIKSNSGRYTIKDISINSEFSDFGVSFWNNKLIFASARDKGGISKRISKWTNQSFLSFYVSQVNPDGNLSEPKEFWKQSSTKFDESTPIFTQDGKTMYFTRNNFFKEKKEKNIKKITKLKLYKAELKNGIWANIVELPFNSNEYNVAHPALSIDDRTLYFASDMPGTMGQSDLFSVGINDDGTYTTPKNLGKIINTEGRETFPFISEDDELYFASDGRPGLGGLDIYVSKIEKGNNYSEVKNVGAPVNGPQDDFAFLIDSKSSNGFFSSNRFGGNGYDDIYKFTEIKKIYCEQILSGIITDQETNGILPESKISLFDEKFQLINETVSDLKGRYHFSVNCGNIYHVRVEKNNYETKESEITILKIAGESDLSFDLDKRIKPIAIGVDLTKTLHLPFIYFDTNKYSIKKESEFELEKVLSVMKQYPKMKIDVRSHTDSRQTLKYNYLLSERRAKSTVAWLIKNGIESYRLTAKGYGESQLINNCSDKVSCTEQEHQVNRRCEFIIIEM